MNSITIGLKSILIDLSPRQITWCFLIDFLSEDFENLALINCQVDVKSVSYQNIQEKQVQCLSGCLLL